MTQASEIMSGLRSGMRHPVAGGSAGVLLLLLAWTVASTVLSSRSIIPTPWDTLSGVISEFGQFYWPNLSATLSRSSQGFLVGNVIGLAVAALVVFVPLIDGLVTQLGMITQCIPVTAIGPILILVMGGYDTSVILAALLVVFTTLVAAVVGMRSVSRTMVEMVTAFKGNSLAVFFRVRMFAALPAIFTALAVAVPGAILGAVVGEFLGGIDTGVGVGLIAAQREQIPERVWGMSLLVGLVSLAGYGLIQGIGRFITPWRATKRSV